MNRFISEKTSDAFQDYMRTELSLVLKKILIRGYPYEYTLENLELIFNGNYIDVSLGSILIRQYSTDGYMDCFFEECSYQKLSQHETTTIDNLRFSLE